MKVSSIETKATTVPRTNREFVNQGIKTRRVHMAPATDNPAPTDDPVTQAKQHLERSQADLRASLSALERPAASAVPSPSPAYIEPSDPPKDLSSDEMRLDLPSMDIPNQGQSFFARRIGWTEYGNLYAAIKAENTTAFMDALTGTIRSSAGLTLRDLTLPDYRYFLYWHRRNSFLRTPLIVTWTSRLYGTQHKTEIQGSTLKIVKLKMTLKEFEGWRAKGLNIPRARDVEGFDAAMAAGVSDDEEFIMGSAQYIDPEWPPVAAKIEALRKENHPYPSLGGRVAYLRELPTIDLAYEIRDFIEAIGTFGVEETVKLTVDKFDPKAALARITRLLESDPPTTPDARKLLDTLAAEKQRLEQGATEPVAEEVPLTFSAWSMFPFDL